MKKPAFSTIELMVTIIVIMIIMASLVPAITKKLNTRSVNIGGTIGTSNSNIEFEPDCSHINSDCELCTSTTCMLCLKICPTGQYAQTSDCTCKPCSDIFSSDCIACTNKKCKKCDSDTKYIDNNTCTICPIGSYCDSINKITCEEGKYTDTEGQTSCIDCEIGYKCTAGIKSPCEEGYYNSSTNQSSCLPCEKGHKCPGASDKIQCTGNQYQDETTQSTCKTCTTEGYYVTDDRTSCTICEAGYYCPGNGTKTQCPAGTYSQTGAKECIPCAKGTYSTTVGATDVSTCQSCPAGKYNNTTGATSCTNCSAGYYSSAGATTCTICPAGKYSSAGSSSCSSCSAGTYSSAGATSCTNCSAGYYSSAGASTCTICPAGKYSTTEGATSCTTCPKGSYCTGGSNKTSCGTGKYLDTKGNDSASDCKLCSSKTPNCTKCNVKTGVCTACGDYYKVNSSNQCVELCSDSNCGSNAMCIVTSASSAMCMMKYNAGDNGFTLPTTVNVAIANGSSAKGTENTCTPSETNFCCWQGKTGHPGDSSHDACSTANGGYSSCTRTVCDWRAANEICSKATYNGRAWRLATKAELDSLSSQITTVSVGVGSNGLMLCESFSSYSSAACGAYWCYGAKNNYCQPRHVWGGYNNSAGTTIDHHNLASGVWSANQTSGTGFGYAFSVRCVSDVE